MSYKNHFISPPSLKSQPLGTSHTTLVNVKPNFHTTQNKGSKTMEKGKAHQTQEQTLTRKSSSSTSTDNRSDDKKSFFTWVFLDQSNLWHAGLSWSIFSLLAIAVPLLSHFVYHCKTCDQNHRRPFDSIVQLSLSVLSLISFISLSSFSRKYGLRRFLFLDKMNGVSDQVQRGYVREVHKSMRLLCAFVLPCFVADCMYKFWWFTSGRNQIPYFINAYLSSTVASFLMLSSWLYRTSIFFLVCILFQLICHLQILRLEDFAQVFHKESDVGLILIKHLTVRRNLHIISHRFRAFILLTLILVMASQFASLLVTLKKSSDFNIFNGGELALTSMTLVTGLLICLRSAAKITHRAQAITSLAAKWNACSTINSFDDIENETPRAQVVAPMVDCTVDNSASNDEEGEEDVIDNTKMMPIFTHTMSYQKRQALVTYFENNRAGITVFGFMLDRASLRIIFAIQLSLTLWLLSKTIGSSPIFNANLE
ncbi:Extracellular ligand-gated ion channel [Heracleum sosnowskyi]|uniref:Extracellular ligand-gated ion channel n=1 Tax=Heracleum sosnowskyi TaxID=360622 RepID=A0AAD8JI77_9APIA|nr:Extracellular ligand-gated ion channel [Heracleum sosnowskyi]